MLDLFSGIGGFSLAASWVWGDELEIVAFCEKDKYCQKVLRKHWPDVPIIEDIRDVRKETIADAKEFRAKSQGVLQTRGTNADGSSIDLITGGFPCQPFSVAGKRRAEKDDRFLWPEMLRIISEIRPAWIIAENVAGIVRLALDNCCSDLESEDYEVQPFIIPACAVNAAHRRDRVWIIAYNECGGCDKRAYGQLQSESAESQRQESEYVCTGFSKASDVANAEASNGRRTDKKKYSRRRDKETGGRCKPGSGMQHRQLEPRMGGMVDGVPYGMDGYFAYEPDVPRVATGIKNRANKLGGLGNAIVPQVAAEIMKAIKGVDKE